MNTSCPERLTLKQPDGWFAATATFRQALLQLSDGPFRLFAYLCLEVNRHTGCLEATQAQLARVLGKSKRAIGSYIAALEGRGLCQVQAGKNQFTPTRFTITDTYWPYQRSPGDSHTGPVETTVARALATDYVATVRRAFLALGCGSGQFNTSQEQLARRLQQQGVSLETVEDAFLLGACRKYVAWLNGHSTGPIASLHYFDSVIAELRQQPLPVRYRDHLRLQIQRLDQQWQAKHQGNASARDSPLKNAGANFALASPAEAKK
jgi:hypothetical protein